jgi:hypothetical protein
MVSLETKEHLCSDIDWIAAFAGMTEFLGRRHARQNGHPEARVDPLDAREGISFQTTLRESEAAVQSF